MDYSIAKTIHAEFGREPTHLGFVACRKTPFSGVPRGLHYANRQFENPERNRTLTTALRMVAHPGFGPAMSKQKARGVFCLKVFCRAVNVLVTTSCRWMDEMDALTIEVCDADKQG
jgi:hypothetical protein